MKQLGTAIILAGGKSSRMGFDKQLIKYKDKPLVEYIIERLNSLFEEIIVVTNTPGIYKIDSIKIISDELSGYGPLGGIHAGLKHASSGFSYVTACDMPEINTAYIDYMIELIRQHSYKAEAVVTRFGEWLEPFNAFYTKALVNKIEEQIAQGNCKISTVLEASNTLYIDEAYARRYSPDWSMFKNINTLEDLYIVE